MTKRFVPYGRQIIDEADIEAVAAVMRGDWLTTGPAVAQFEEAFSDFVGAQYGVAVSNGTAALHVAALAAGFGPGDEVIVAAMTFAASANMARYVGADVVFADVRSDTLTIDPNHVASLITDRTRAIVAVDFAGVPCDLDELRSLCEQHDLLLIEDACHAPGGTYRGRPIGSIADLSIFSFHPVKHLTTAEGGMVTTDSPELAERMRQYRNHGIKTDFRQREEQGTWAYDMAALGFNYRLPDLNCALGISQLAKLPDWVEARRRIAARYNTAFADFDGLRTLTEPEDRTASWHLFPVIFEGPDSAAIRASAFENMRAAGIGVNVHYLPVYLHSYYRNLGYEPGLCPVAETAYAGLLSLPMWPGLTDEEQDRVVEMVGAAVGA
ncbi:MAG: UDP-4-amino-4,6-dideoxy-N-acetyl-beta-L-altrosamine transaminase [Acidimicrobiia bacterium]|nr:UDP-4-amino-4,6-dideoxy-N-acetyl-beta-L-altrosamine transaminase [Acidimicrobiia bacterium]